MNEISQEEKTWGMLAHLSSFATFIVPLGNVVGPLMVWLVKKEAMPFVGDQAKEALNFNITMTIVGIVAFLLAIVLFVVVVVGWMVLTLMAAMEANKGVAYRYPFALRLIS